MGIGEVSVNLVRMFYLAPSNLLCAMYLGATDFLKDHKYYISITTKQNSE
jgi:hypothetical protein